MSPRISVFSNLNLLIPSNFESTTYILCLPTPRPHHPSNSSIYNKLENTTQTAKNICQSLRVMNQSKPVHIRFYTIFRSYLIAYYIISLSQPKSTKRLGITIDERLNWQLHLGNHHKKISSALTLRRIREITDKQRAFIAYQAIFGSHLKFGIISWGGANKDSIKKIFFRRPLAQPLPRSLETKFPKNATSSP